jgi:hypothetical protein
MSEENKKPPKVSQKKLHEKLQCGLDANGWAIYGTGGTKVAFIKPLIEYLRKAGIEVV